VTSALRAFIDSGAPPAAKRAARVALGKLYFEAFHREFRLADGAALSAQALALLESGKAVMFETLAAHPNARGILHWIEDYVWFARNGRVMPEAALSAFIETLYQQTEGRPPSYALLAVRFALAEWEAKRSDPEDRGRAQAQAALEEWALLQASKSAEAPEDVEGAVAEAYAVGMLYFHAGQAEAALAHFEQALADYDYYIGCENGYQLEGLEYMTLTAAYIRGFLVGTHDDGIAAYAQMLTDFPDGCETGYAWWQLGNLYSAKKDYVNAYALYDYYVAAYGEEPYAGLATGCMQALETYFLPPGAAKQVRDARAAHEQGEG